MQLDVATGSTRADVDACVALWLEAIGARDGHEPVAGTAEHCRAKFDATIVSWRLLRGADPRLLGFGLATTTPATGDDAYLGLLAVSPSIEGRGGAGRLIDTVIADAATAGLPGVVLNVMTDNTRAIGLYASRGFVAAGAPHEHALTGREAQRYRRDLTRVPRP